MIGAIVIAVVLVVGLPVAVLASGAVASALFAHLLTLDGQARYEGSELVDLYR